MGIQSKANIYSALINYLNLYIWTNSKQAEAEINAFDECNFVAWNIIWNALILMRIRWLDHAP